MERLQGPGAAHFVLAAERARRLGKEGLKPLAAAALLALAACASGESAEAPLPSGYAPPAAVATRPAYSPAPPPKPADSCGASELAWLVGKPKEQIPIPVELSNRRVLCTTCPRTEEYIPRRLNIYFDLDSGVVQQVACG